MNNITEINDKNYYQLLTHNNNLSWVSGQKYNYSFVKHCTNETDEDMFMQMKQKKSINT